MRALFCLKSGCYANLIPKRLHKKQQASGLVRYELQVLKRRKAVMEEMASEFAKEYASPRSLKQRMCRARVEVLQKATPDNFWF